MDRSNKGSRRIRLEEFMRLSDKISGQLSHIGHGQPIHKGRALELAVANGAKDLTNDKLQYMLDKELVRPAREEHGDREVLVFSADDIRDIILIQTLRQGSNTNGHPCSYTDIANLLRERAEGRKKSEAEQAVYPADIGVPTQKTRGLVLLHSRVLGICLTWLFSGRIPKGAIVVLRRRLYDFQQQIGSNVPHKHTLSDFPAMDKYLGDLRSNDLAYYVSREGELLQLSASTLRPFAKYWWHCWTVSHGTPRYEFALVVGLSQSPAQAAQVVELDDSAMALLLALLLEACFLEPDKEDPARPPSPMEDANNDIITPLALVAHVLPKISPIWRYCAIFVPEAPQSSHLRILAASRGFPLDMEGGLSIESGQLLTGWVYKYGYPAVIQHSLGPSDPRLTHQESERATAAAAVPTRVAGKPNGALYMATNAPLGEGSLSFSDAETRLLQLVADILGEIIDRNRIRVSGERMALQTINEPPRRSRPWCEYKEEIAKVVSGTAQAEQVFGPRDNLQIMAVRIENYELLFEHNPSIAQWASNHIRETTHRFYLENNLGSPTFFERDAANCTAWVVMRQCEHNATYTPGVFATCSFHCAARRSTAAASFSLRLARSACGSPR